MHTNTSESPLRIENGVLSRQHRTLHRWALRSVTEFDPVGPLSPRWGAACTLRSMWAGSYVPGRFEPAAPTEFRSGIGTAWERGRDRDP